MQRKIRALRNLAERPGTEAEGQLAREILARFESKFPPLDQEWSAFESYLRSGSLDDLAKASRYKTCDCGNRHPSFTICPLSALHEKITAEIRLRFPRGTRVYYNRWAYTVNCPAYVSGYCKSWSWIRLKFDELSTTRAVPIYRAGLWHLSTEPIEDPAIRVALRGGN